MAPRELPHSHPETPLIEIAFMMMLAIGLIGLGPWLAAGASPTPSDQAKIERTTLDKTKSDKTGLLKEKLAAMEALRGQIGIKLIEASTKRNSLAGRIDPLELEIQALSSEYGITGFSQTPDHPDVQFGLMNLSYLYGYHDAIRGAIARLREVDHALQYLHQQVRDDLEVIATLSDFTIDALVNRIDGTLDFPEAHQSHLIDAAQLNPPAAETVFRRIVAAP